MERILGVKEVTIIYVEFPDEDWRREEQRFKTVKELRDYFHEHIRFGEIVGYVVFKKRPQAFNDHQYKGQLEIEWTDDKSSYVRKSFKDVWDFVGFLKENKVLGDAVGYVPK